MQMGFYFNQSRCTGCDTCIIACKDWHDVPAGPASWIRVTTIEKGKYPNVSVAFMFIPCYHCEEPTCMPACPVSAITKREEDGVVVVDRETCLGKDNCELCLEACPYDAPQFGAEENANMTFKKVLRKDAPESGAPFFFLTQITQSEKCLPRP